MLVKYNDGETTFILQLDARLNVDEIDYFMDINPGDKTAAAYARDGESIFIFNVIAEEPSTEEPHMEEL